jgi:hypothetical protein
MGMRGRETEKENRIFKERQREQLIYSWIEAEREKKRGLDEEGKRKRMRGGQKRRRWEG